MKKTLCQNGKKTLICLAFSVRQRILAIVYRRAKLYLKKSQEKIDIMIITNILWGNILRENSDIRHTIYERTSYSRRLFAYIGTNLYE